MKITYTRSGDFLLPDIKLKIESSTEPLGRYARMRRAYLNERRTTLYNTLLLSERLYPHLREIDETAKELQARGMPEEIILAELVYDY